jgi:diguanylate cyclase (GGDEF)-like protein
LRDLAYESRTRVRELEPAALSPRVAALVYLVAGVLAFFVGRVHLVAIAAAVFGAVSLVLPWPRWPMRAQLVFAAVAFVLFAWGGVLASGPVAPYLALLPLPFVFVGFTQRPGTSALLVPLAAVSLIIAARMRMDASLASTLLFALPLSVLVGETMAQAELHRRRAERRVERLLHAVRVLARVEDERTGAQLVASFASEVLNAQAVSVMLADRAGGRRYLNRAFFGHPALADTAPLLLDRLGPDGESGATFVTLPNTGTAVRAALVVAFSGGLIVAMWGTPRRRLHAAARQAAELLSEEAGRMFERLRLSAALEHDAHTDPLTDLANRRTFTRALDTLQPGDALVIVDLDHFKMVNDRFGHQVGDQALRVLAECLRDTARQVDTLARYGGEEFAIVLPGAGAKGALAFVTRVRRAWNARTPATTFSAGIAVHEVEQSPRATLRRADAALYVAKEGGRDRDVVAPASEVLLP